MQFNILHDRRSCFVTTSLQTSVNKGEEFEFIKVFLYSTETKKTQL